MEFGPQNHYEDGLLGLDFRVIVYMDPLGNVTTVFLSYDCKILDNSIHIMLLSYDDRNMAEAFVLLLGLEDPSPNLLATSQDRPPIHRLRNPSY